MLGQRLGSESWHVGFPRRHSFNLFVCGRELFFKSLNFGCGSLLIFRQPFVQSTLLLGDFGDFLVRVGREFQQQLVKLALRRVELGVDGFEQNPQRGVPV